LRSRLLIPFLIATLAVLLLFSLHSFTGFFAYEKAYVSRVIDGDTFVTSSGDRIRLAGINAPEKGMPLSDEATSALEALIAGKEVVLKPVGFDRYGRLLAYVWVEHLFVNEQMLREGYAHTFFLTESSYSQALIDAERDAREKQIGIWRHSPYYGCVELQLSEKAVLTAVCDAINTTRWLLIDEDHRTFYLPSRILQKGEVIQLSICSKLNCSSSLFLQDANGLLVAYLGSSSSRGV